MSPTVGFDVLRPSPHGDPGWYGTCGLSAATTSGSSCKSAVSVIVIDKRTIRTHLFVYVSSREVSLEPVLWILVLVIVCQAIRLLHLVVLVISGIDDDGRVMSPSGDVCGALFLD